MSAKHECPHCRKPFEYAPSDFHKQRVCGNPGCAKLFGFWQAPVSARRLAEVKKELLGVQEERLRKWEAKARREGRTKGRAEDGCGGGAAAATAERAFELELSDSCPRCGHSMARGSVETHAEHLARCSDAAAHKAHAARVAAAAKRAAAGAAAEVAGAEAAALAGWEAGGRVLGTLWALPRGAVAALCAARGLPAAGEKVELIRRFVAHARRPRGVLALEDAAGGSSGGGGGAAAAAARVDAADISAVEAHELPANLHRMDAEALACVCASFGLEGDAAEGKGALIKRLERRQFAGRLEDVGMPMLADAADSGDEGAGGRKRKRIEDD